MSKYILLIFPALLLVLLFAGAKIRKKGEYSEDLFSLDTSKNLQVIAAFGVLLHHLVQHVTRYGDINKGPITIFNSFGILFTSIFFFSSGYGLVTSYLSKENYLKDFFLKRYTKLLVPFAITNVIYLMPLGLAEGRIHTWVDTLMALFGIALMNTNAWFIVEILIFYLVFFLSFKFIKNKRNSIIAITIFTFVLVTVSLFLGHDHTYIGGMWFMGEWWYNTSLLFPLGLIVGFNKDRIIKFLQKFYLLIALVSVAMFAVTFYVEEYVLKRYGYYCESYTYAGYPQKMITCLAQTVTCMCFMIMLTVIFYKIKTGNILLKLIAPFCMELYLIHGLFLYQYDALNSMPEPVHFAMVIIGSVLIAIALYFADKFIVRFIIAFRKGEYKNKAVTIEGILKEKWINKQVKKYFTLIVILASITVVGVCGVIIYNTVGRSIYINKELKAISEANVGDVVGFGHFNFEQVKWRVIAKVDGKALLITDTVLFEYYYNQKHAACTYENSDLRKLLINEGYYEVFYTKEREAIVPDSNCKDTVFLLTMEEANTYFESDFDRAALDQRILRDNGDVYGLWWENKIKGHIWWLRGEKESIKAPVVFLDGHVMDEGKNVNTASIGVRPSIWVECQN